MKATGFYSNLIRDIHNVRSKAVLKVFHIRIKNYHKKLLQHQPGSDIKPPLLDCIHNLIYNKHDIELFTISDKTDLTSNPEIQAKFHSIDTHEIDPITFNELSNYFKTKHNCNGVHTGIEDTLVQSTWDHIHAALRYARQAEMANSKMHAEIACYSCKELAHFMPEDKYQKLMNNIQLNLKILH